MRGQIWPTSLAFLLMATLCLAACNNPRSSEALRGVDPAIDLLLDMTYGDYCTSFLHPDGGFLVCREGIRGWGTVARLDSSGAELWRAEVGSTNGVEVVGVDNTGRIYAYSKDRVLDVISPDGTVLWSRKELSDEISPAQISEDGSSIMVQTRRGLLLLDRDGNEVYRLDYQAPNHYDLQGYFHRDDDDVLRMLLGWHFTGDPPDPASCGVHYEMLDSRGEPIWQHSAGGLTPGNSSLDNAGLTDRHTVGRLRVMPDGRAILLREDMLFEFDSQGQAQQIAYDLEDPQILFSMLDEESALTPEGNYLFCDSNTEVSEGNGLMVLEFSPAFALLHMRNYNHTDIDGESSGEGQPHPQRKGLGYYDMYTRQVYLYLDRDYGARSGSIFLLARDGSILDAWKTGEGSISQFFRREDGRIVARRSGGDLLLLPELSSENTSGN